MGLLAFYLRERTFSADIVGVDFDEGKVSTARDCAQAHYSGLQFRAQDVAEARDFHGNVVVLDVLQYLEFEKQKKLLQQLPQWVGPRGKCLIRATPHSESWRFTATRVADRAMYLASWMKSPALHYLREKEIVAPFVSANFTCDVRPLWGNTPFNSYLFVFQRPAGTSDSGAAR